MSRTQNSITLVCYDITGNKLRRRIDKCLKDFGVRLQCSVFMCRLDAYGVAKCRERLNKLLTQYHKEKSPGDSLIIFERFNPDSADCLLGGRIENESPKFGIF